MSVIPYLFFEGRCEEALEFYKYALGAEVTMLMRMRESPEPPQGLAPENQDKIMHSAFKVSGTEIMASDGMCSGAPSFTGVNLSIQTKTPEEAHKLFAALCEGGQARMPMAQTFFSPAFGMAADRFGLGWMVMALPEGQS